MNIITSIILVSSLLLSLNVNAEVSTSDDTSLLVTFKCHIETAKGSNIAVFVWEPQLVIEKQSALLAKHVSTITNERLMVKRVIECITEDKVFKDVLVREQDAQRTH